MALNEEEFMELQNLSYRQKQVISEIGKSSLVQHNLAIPELEKKFI
jgi:hypothetical protein